MTSDKNMIPQVELGQTGFMIGAQGLGCMGMSEFYGVTDERASLETLQLAIERGVTMFDTADMYGIGANETFLAPFVRQHRENVLIATKFGYARTVDNPDDWSVDNSPEFIRAAVDRSLKRLGVEAIDLYYMHRRASDMPLEDSIGAMADLVKAGKVKWLGLCSVSADELKTAHTIHPIAALQSEWSIFTRGIEEEVVPVAAELGVTLVPYSPLGRGMLTGQLSSQTLTNEDARQNFPRFSGQNLAVNLKLVARIEEIARDKSITAAQLALGWLYTKAASLGVTAVPIPGTRKRSRLEENLAATSIRLTDAEMKSIEPLAAAVQGVAV
jgi:aryl-alcohol dehydrogenase-like predicted oxidoreductase